MRIALVAVALVGCKGDVDLLAGAYGDCVATVALDGSDAGAGTATMTYDPNGDPVSWEGGYEAASAYDWTTAYAYGAPHEPIEETWRFPNQPEEDQAWTYVWEDGLRVREGLDLGLDGDEDYAVRSEYDAEGRLVRMEWDHDGDGGFEDHLDYAWTADGDEWEVVGTGVDANGEYGTEERWTADLRLRDYQYWDSTGLELDWSVDGFTEVGAWGDYEAEYRQDGAVFRTTTIDRAHDELGRVTLSDAVTVDWDAGEAIDETTRSQAWTYACD